MSFFVDDGFEVVIYSRHNAWKIGAATVMLTELDYLVNQHFVFVFEPDEEVTCGDGSWRIMFGL